MTRREAAKVAQQAHSDNRTARLESYRELRSWGFTYQQAAWRLGVHYRTIMRYERALRAAA